MSEDTRRDAFAVDSDADSDEDLPAGIPIIRQWVSLPKASTDVRVGSGAIDAMGEVLRRPAVQSRPAALVVEEGAEEALAEDVRRQLTDAGCLVTCIDIPAQRTLAAASALAAKLAGARVTSDDIVCAVGSVDVLSLAAAVAHEWCGGTTLVAVPTDAAAAAWATITPRGLDVDGVPELIWTPGYARNCFGDLAEFAQQMVDMLKSRGRLSASTSIAVRQSLTYGETFLRAMRPLVPADVPDSAVLADAMRFTSRISCGQENLSVDDVLAIDELLTRLDLGQIAGHIEPEQMIAALKADRFRYSSRFLLGLPRALGRVRLANVEDDLLAEHTKMFCATREA